MTANSDTIVARASGAGKAGVAVFRLSGPDAFAIAQKLCGRIPNVRRAAIRKIKDKFSTLIDEGLVIAFKGPCSFTGEDTIEFHLHGSRAIEAAFLEAAAGFGARAASPGEFTRKALVNGRLDLAQVEALSDLIEAETSRQRIQALGQFGGRLSSLAEGWKRRLIAVLSPLEAEIDFPDEEGVPAAVAARARPAIDALVTELRSYLSEAVRARRIREGIEIAIIGAPNAGKSSLLNRLAGAPVAIVSDRPGTTRDIVEVRLDLEGLQVILADTAGLREATRDDIEAEGMRRALCRAKEADIRVLVIDGAKTRPPLEKEGLGGDRAPAPEAGMAHPAFSPETSALLNPGDFVVLNKSDLLDPSQPPPFQTGAAAVGSARLIQISAKTGDGVEELVRLLSKAVRERYSPTEGGALTRLRHAQAVEKAVMALERAKSRIGAAPELAAEDARLAARALGEITGEVGVEDILDEIFSSFCIGK